MASPQETFTEPEFDLRQETGRNSPSEYYAPDMYWDCNDGSRSATRLKDYSVHTKINMVGYVIQGLTGNRKYAYTVKNRREKLVTLLKGVVVSSALLDKWCEVLDQHRPL